MSLSIYEGNAVPVQFDAILSASTPQHKFDYFFLLIDLCWLGVFCSCCATSVHSIYINDKLFQWEQKELFIAGT